MNRITVRPLAILPGRLATGLALFLALTSLACSEEATGPAETQSTSNPLVATPGKAAPAPRGSSSERAATDESAEQIELLRTFDATAEGAGATLLGFDANVAIGRDGVMTLTPTPTFDATGQNVTPRRRYATQLATLGRKGDVRDFGAPESLNHTAGGDVHLRYEGGVTVAYANRPAGLKQSVFVPERPAGEGRLRLAFSLDGAEALASVVSKDGQTVRVGKAGRSWFEWTGLIVTDAEGKTIDARMRMADGQLVYEIDDDAAVYPLNVDPLATAPSWTHIRPGTETQLNFAARVVWAGDVNGDNFDDILVAQSRHDGTYDNQGRALLFLGSGNSLSATAAWTATGNSTNAFFSAAFTALGDINGDGLDDVAISAAGGQVTQAFEGIVYVYLGHATAGLQPAAALTISSGVAAAFFGTSVASGDFNCDGQADLAVGANTYSPVGANAAGRGYVFWGDASSYFDINNPWTHDGEQASAFLGAAAASLGNVDADTNGCDDVAFGAPNYDAAGLSNSGRVKVFYGSPAGLPQTADWTYEGTKSNVFVGERIRSAGDINSDGIDDALLGAPRFDDTFTDEGAVFIFHGTASGLPQAATRIIYGGQAGARLGTGLAHGDINGDGFGDVVLGAPLYATSPPQQEGAAFLYLGTSNGLTQSPAWTGGSGESNSQYGTALAAAGDVNNDGYDDLIVGAPLEDGATGEVDVGRVYLYRGRPTCFIGGEFYSGGEVNPANPCQVCDPSSATDAWSDLPDGLTCTDGNACTTATTCQTGQCVGTAVVCNDADTCTADSCDPATGCDFEPIVPAPAACGGGCTVDADCNDGNACTVDSCNTATGVCTFDAGAADGNSCEDDGDTCTNDFCQAGSCIHPVVANVCQIGDRCYPAGANNPVDPCEVCDIMQTRTGWSPRPFGTACSDGRFCTALDYCDGAGDCVSGQPRDCSAFVRQCAPTPFCSELDKRCVALPGPNGVTCDDGDLCTLQDACLGGVCAGTPQDCSVLGDECSDGVCDPQTGSCVVRAVPAGTSCDTNDACLDGVCQGGVCQTLPTDCDDDNPCTADSCDIVNGCSSTPVADMTACDDDGLACTNDVCISGTCQHDITMGCAIDGACYAEEASDPQNVCLFCDTKEPEEWTSRGIETVCGAIACSDDGAGVIAPVCNGVGGCIPGPYQDCGLYSCVDGACLTTCEADGDCDDGTVCNAQGACVPDGTNVAPIAIVRGPNVVECGETVTLSASDSVDPNGDPISYDWSQVMGAPDLLQGIDLSAQTITFTTPTGLSDPEIFRFQLLVSDGERTSAPDEHDVFVPACEETGGDAGPDAGADAGPDAGGDAGTDAGADAGPTSDIGEPMLDGALQGSGCACSAADGAPKDASGLALLLVGALVALRRRRR